MGVIRAWIPELYDEPLKKLLAAGLTDTAIGDRMQFDPAEVTRARRRLGLRPNKRFTASPERVQDGPAPKFKPNPLVIAEQKVPGFNRETMTRNGRPIKLEEIMLLCNAELKREGLGQIGPSHWRV